MIKPRQFSFVVKGIMLLALMVNLAYAGTSPSALFTYVSSLPRLKQKLALAASQHRPVIIEFFATWCPYCKQVDRDVLSDDSIQRSLKRFMALRVDVSDNTATNSEMMNEYNVEGVPTMVFYDKNGNMASAASLDGGINRDNLQSVLNQLSL